jgi:hypothetical protein
VLVHFLQDVPQETPVTHCSPRKEKARAEWPQCNPESMSCLLVGYGIPLLSEFWNSQHVNNIY